MQLNRYSPPTKLDSAPKGTVCFVRLHEAIPGFDFGQVIVYTQTSEDEDNPKWELND
jgi:hypothetical protein